LTLIESRQLEGRKPASLVGFFLFLVAIS